MNCPYHDTMTVREKMWEVPVDCQLGGKIVRDACPSREYYTWDKCRDKAFIAIT